MENFGQIKDDEEEIMKKKRKFETREDEMGCRRWKLWRCKNVKEMRGENGDLKETLC